MCESHRGRPRSNGDGNISRGALLSQGASVSCRIRLACGSLAHRQLPALHVLRDSLRDMQSVERVCFERIAVAEGGG